MRAVAIVFVACLSLFTARFVACEGTGPSDGPVYEDVLKNSMNRFLKSRMLVDHPMGCINSMDTTKLGTTGIKWSVGIDDFEVNLVEASWRSDCDYVVTGVKLRVYPGTPKVSFGVNLTISEARIDKFAWVIRRRWGVQDVDESGEFAVVYKNMTATILIDVEPTEKDGNVFGRVTGTHIDPHVALFDDPVKYIPLLKKLPQTVPFRRLQIELRRLIASQLEAKLSTFCDELFRECSWLRILLGRF